jgi:hypothetical protein
VKGYEKLGKKTPGTLNFKASIFTELDKDSNYYFDFPINNDEILLNQY